MIEGKRLAIIIGVDKYLHANGCLPALEGVENDVVELCNKLGDPNIGSFKIYKDMYILGSKATCQAIREAISEVFWKTGSGHEYDLVLFYFSGHGVRDTYGNGYIVPYDMLPDEPFVRGIKMQELVEMASKSKMIKAVVMILDCCYSGIAAETTKSSSLEPSSKEEFRETITLPGRPQPEVESYLREVCAKGRVILASGGKDKTSRETVCRHTSKDTPHTHGEFTSKLIEALDGNAATKDGYITLYSLKKYLTDHLKEEYIPKYEQGSIDLDLIQIAMSDTMHKEAINKLVRELEKNCSRCRIDSAHNAVLNLLALTKMDEKNLNIITLQKSVEQNLSTLSLRMRRWFLKNGEALANGLDSISIGLYGMLILELDKLDPDSENWRIDKMDQISVFNFGVFRNLLSLLGTPSNEQSIVDSFISNVRTMWKMSNMSSQFDERQSKELSSEKPKELSSEKPKELLTGPAK
jgi:hypothetical protein